MKKTLSAIATLSALCCASALPVRSMRGSSDAVIANADAVAAAAAAKAADASLRAFPEAGVEISTAGWSVLGAADPAAVVPVFFGLPDRNRETIDRIFREVSDPDHANYGRYLAADEITAIVRPAPEHAERVLAWLATFGDGVRAAKVIGHGDYIRADVTVAAAQRMFEVRMLAMQHMASGRTLIRAPQVYSIPHALARSVVFVDGVHRLPAIPSGNPGGTATGTNANTGKVADAGNWPNYCGDTCADMITPKVLRQRYNVTRNATTGKSFAAVAEFQGQNAVPSDLAQFQSICGLPDKPMAKIVGPDSGGAGVEASLDVDAIAGVAPNVGLWFWGLEQYNLLEWIQQVAANDDAPHVHSVSYGNDETQNNKDMMEKVDADFQRLAVGGRSIIVASGDQGARGRTGTIFGKFHTSWPAVSPYVTAVGATQFPGSTIGHETCTSWSGGGFSSEVFLQQDYQADAVAAFFKSGVKLPSEHLYNAKGRGFPDVSVNGGGNQRYCVTANGVQEGVAGTSASCPAFAAMVALLNDVRFSQGKSAMGFLNPLLYSKGPANGFFDDITTGNNADGHLLGEGWEATTGWDPCSGLGNPSLDKMIAYVANEK